MVLKATHLDKITKEVEVEERSKKRDPGTQGGEEEQGKETGRSIWRMGVKPRECDTWKPREDSCKVERVIC